MKQTFDTDSILFGLLKGSSELTTAITGGVYAGQRPDNSELEDIVVNTIDLTQEYHPQIGTSNINIHVADKMQTVSGVQMKLADRARLKELSAIVLSVIRSAKFTGLKIIVSNQNTIREADINQHFVNIRINWNIHD